MSNKKVLELGMALMVLVCVAAGCPGFQSGGTAASHLVLGRWIVLMLHQYGGIAEVILVFYEDGTCALNFDGGVLLGAWFTQFDGTVIADFRDTVQTQEGLVVYSCKMELQVGKYELTGTFWDKICDGDLCDEAPGIVEGIRVLNFVFENETAM